MILTLSACSTAPDKVYPSHVSDRVYQDYTCAELNREVHHVERQSRIMHHDLKEARGKDTAAVAVGMILFWPALLFLASGNEDTTAYARLKGEAIALQDAQIAAKCDFEPVVFEEIKVPLHVRAKQDKRTRIERRRDLYESRQTKQPTETKI